MKNRKFIQALFLLMIMAIVPLNLFLTVQLSSSISSSNTGTDMIDDAVADSSLVINNSLAGVLGQDIEGNENDSFLQSETTPAFSLEPATFFRPGGEKNYGERAVTFMTSDGQILENQTVNTGEKVVPPENPPVPPGEIFIGWDTDIDKITDGAIVKEETVNVAGMENAIALSGGYCQKGETVTIPLQLCGKVSLSGLDLSIGFNPQELQFKEFSYEDDAVICNYDNKKGEIKLNFLTPRNVQEDVELCDMVFKAIGNGEETPLSITVKTIIAFDDNDDLYEPKYRTIDGTVGIIK